MLGGRQVLSLTWARDLSDFPLGRVLRCGPLWPEIGAELIIMSQANLLGNIQRTNLRVYYGQEFSKARKGTDTQPSRKDDSSFWYIIYNCVLCKALTLCSLLLLSFLMSENLFYIQTLKTNHISKDWTSRTLKVIPAPNPTFQNLKNIHLFIQHMSVVSLLCARYSSMHWEYINKWDKKTLPSGSLYSRISLP